MSKQPHYRWIAIDHAELVTEMEGPDYWFLVLRQVIEGRRLSITLPPKKDPTDYAAVRKAAALDGMFLPAPHDKYEVLEDWYQVVAEAIRRTDKDRIGGQP